MPAEVVGTPVIMVGVAHVGETAAGLRAVAPLRRLGTPLVDTVAPRAYLEHQAVIDAANHRDHRYHWSSQFVAELGDEVQINCPQRPLPLQHQVVPFVHGTVELAETLVTAGQRIGIVPVIAADASTADQVITIGPGPAPTVGLRAYGHAWSGAISNGEIAPGTGPPRSSLPFGPYVAAALATSEIFRAVRGNIDRFPAPARVCYSLYSHRTQDEWFDDGPPEIPSLRIDAALAGAGAVGCAWLHTIRACSDLSGSVVVADDDADGVDVTNLNRGSLLTIKDVGAPKAEVAVAAAARTGLQLTAHVGKVETALNPPRFMVVAADTNRARAGIQSRYPFPLLFASTSNLRAEVVRCDPTRDGPCMRCHNPPHDETIRRRTRRPIPRREPS